MAGPILPGVKTDDPVYKEWLFSHTGIIPGKILLQISCQCSFPSRQYIPVPSSRIPQTSIPSFGGYPRLSWFPLLQILLPSKLQPVPFLSLLTKRVAVQHPVLYRLYITAQQSGHLIAESISHGRSPSCHDIPVNHHIFFQILSAVDFRPEGSPYHRRLPPSSPAAVYGRILR